MKTEGRQQNRHFITTFLQILEMLNYIIYSYKFYLFYSQYSKEMRFGNILINHLSIQ